MLDILKLTRNEIAEFAKTQRAIRFFELLQRQVVDIAPTDYDTLQAGINLAQATATQAENDALVALDEIVTTNLNVDEVRQIASQAEIEAQLAIAGLIEQSSRINDVEQSATYAEMLALQALNREVASSGGGGSIVTNSTTLTVSPAKHKEVTVNLVASSTPSSLINAWLVPNADWDLDDLNDISINANSNAGSIDFLLSTNGPLVGDFKVAYQIL